MKHFSAPACLICHRNFGTEEALNQHMAAKHRNQSMNVAGPLCIECGGTAEIVGGETIYPHRPDLYDKRFWLCTCGAYCGCHGVTTRPLGNPCGPETRRARMAAHAAFDPIWRRKEMGRREAYTWLSQRMGLEFERTHIGMFTKEQAHEVVRHCRDRRRVVA